MSEATFETKLDVLTSGELIAARGDSVRMGAMLEKLARTLGFTVAVAARGDPAGIDEFCMGITDYIHGEAVTKAPMARFLEQAKALPND